MKNSLSAHFAAQALQAGTQSHWQRSNLAAWRDARDDNRARWDEVQLTALRAAMQQSAMGAAALAWADQHGVDIIVDHRTTASGYYWAGTGVIAIAARQVARAAFFAHAVDVLTHEIRHAWQDHQGLLVHGNLPREAMLEADADAHGKLAGLEYKYHLTRLRIASLQMLQKEKTDRARTALIKTLEIAARKDGLMCRNSARALRHYFVVWQRQHAAAYAQVWRTSGCDQRFEYLPPADRVTRIPADGDCESAVKHLGNSFTGINYLQGAPVKMPAFAGVKP